MAAAASTKELSPPLDLRPLMATPVAPNEASDAGSRKAKKPCFDAAKAAGIFRKVPGRRQSLVMRVHHSSKRISVNVWGCPICGARSIASTGRGFLLIGVGASDVATCFGLVGSVSMGSLIVRLVRLRRLCSKGAWL